MITWMLWVSIAENVHHTFIVLQKIKRHFVMSGTAIRRNILLLLLMFLMCMNNVVVGQQQGNYEVNPCAPPPAAEQQQQQCSPTLPLGATYETTFEFRFIGKYSVHMLVMTENKARLIVKGGFPIRDFVRYQLLLSNNNNNSNNSNNNDHDDADDGNDNLRFSVELSDKLKGILKRFTVSLTELRYDEKGDAVSVRVSVLYMLTFHLSLHRRV